MKKNIVFILFINGFLFSFGQNCESIYQNELKFKEIFDYLGSHKFPYTINGNNYQDNAFAYPPNNYIYPNDADEAELQFGTLESVGNLLESLIRMYEITHDKAYLIKAINRSIQLINARGGATAPSPYAWASGYSNTSVGSDNVYIPNVPGNVLHPLAHLCHLILNDEYSTLCPATLPLSPENLIPNLPSLPQNTYGQFADWLVHRCVESLDWCITTFWVDDFKCFREEYSDFKGAAINQQAPYASALFYLGHLKDVNPCFAYQGYYSGLQSYMDRATILANKYIQPNKIYNDNDDEALGNIICYDSPVFKYIPSHNSYWWLGDGWGSRTFNNTQCDVDAFKHSVVTNFQHFYNNPNGDVMIEDISHGIRTLCFPIILNKYNFTSGGIQYFGNPQMMIFRNTLLNNSWNQDNINPKFYSTVSGANYELYASNSACGSTPCFLDYFKWATLRWMSFAEYEFPNSTLYDLLITKYKNLVDDVDGSMGNFINGDRMNGIAEFVNQNWKRECYDLTLYNRKLTYNQNFFAKHNLDIFPTADNCYHAANDESFADPIITSNDFVIEPQVHSVFEADNRVTLKGEVHFKAGSEVTVRNTLGSCYTNGRTGNQTASNEGETIEMSPPMQQQTIPSDEPLDNKVIKTKNIITLTPNPANKQFTVSSNVPITQMTIYALTGQTMTQVQQLNQYKFDFNVYEVPNGVYFVSIETQAGREIKKVVIAKE